MSFYLFLHPLERPGLPGRWPFYSCFTFAGQENELHQDFLCLDGRGPGILNSNMDPCILSDPFPWFLSFCRIDAQSKDHNKVVSPDGKSDRLLNQAVEHGDIILFGGILDKKNFECKSCDKKEVCPAHINYLWIDTVFKVSGTLELPVEERGNACIFTLNSVSGYKSFREDASRVGIELPESFEQFEQTNAWRYNLSDTLKNHSSTDYSPYYMILSDPENSFMPFCKGQRKEIFCPLFRIRQGLYVTEIGKEWDVVLNIFDEKSEKSPGVLKLPQEIGESVLKQITNTCSRINRVSSIFSYNKKQVDVPLYKMDILGVLKALGYSQKQVSSWKEIQFVTLNKVSRNQGHPSLKFLSRLAQVIGCQMKDLFHEDEGSARKLLHEIASCTDFKKTFFFPQNPHPCNNALLHARKKNTEAATSHDSGLKEIPLDKTFRPEPWTGRPGLARLTVIIGQPMELSQGHYPTFSKQWYPGRTESFFANRLVRLAQKAEIHWRLGATLKMAQLFLNPDRASLCTDIAIVPICHCHIDSYEARQSRDHCIDRFFVKTIDISSGIVVMEKNLDEFDTVRAYLAKNGADLQEFDWGSLFMLPTKDDTPCLTNINIATLETSKQDADKACKIWNCIASSLSKPKLVFLAKKRFESIKIQPELVQALQLYSSGSKSPLDFKLFGLLKDRELIARALFFKIINCPHIKAWVDGSRANPCNDIFLSYGGTSPKNIFLPIPWAGDILNAPILCVGFKAPLKKRNYYTYEDNASVEKIQSYFRSAIGQEREAPYINIFRILSEISPPVHTTSKEKQSEKQSKVEGLVAYLPLVHCRSRLKEGAFPIGISRLCMERYFSIAIALSGAKVIFIQGKNASKEVCKLLDIEGNIETGFVYEIPELEKIMVFLPSAKGGFYKLSNEDLEKLEKALDQINSLISDVNLSIKHISLLRKVTKKRRL